MKLNDIGKYGDFAKKFSGFYKTTGDSLKELIKNINNFQNIESATKALNLANVSQETASLALNLSKFNGETEGIKKALEGLGTSGEVNGKKISGLGSAFSGLTTLIKAHPFATAGTAIAAVATVAYTAYKNYKENLVASSNEITSNWNNQAASFDALKQKYIELKSLLDSGTLDETQSYNTKMQILDIQNQIVGAYGSAASNVNLINGELSTQLALLDQISVKEAKKTILASQDEYEDTEQEMTKSRTYGLTGGGLFLGAEGIGKDIYNIAQKYKSEGLKTDLTEDGSYTINFKGDISQAEETVSSFITELNALRDKYKDDDNAILQLDNVVDTSNSKYKDIQTTLGKYQDNYNKFLKMDMISQGTEEGSPSAVYTEYANAVNQYNQALTSGDTTAIETAAERFHEATLAKDKLFSEPSNKKFATLFQDISDQLAEASIKANDFHNALIGSSNEINQFDNQSKGLKSAADSLKNRDLSGDDVLYALQTKGSQAGETAIWELASQWGITADSSSAEMQAFIDVLVDAGIVSGTAQQALSNLTSSFESTATSIQQATDNISTLKSIMSESFSGNGISPEGVSAFREIFGDATDSALEKTANGYHINQEALAGLQAQQEALTKSDYLTNLNDHYTQLQSIESQIATAEFNGQDTSGLEAIREQILSQITSLQELQYQYETANSAYNQWQAAMSGGEEGDMYDSISGSKDSMQDMYNEGLTGTNKFREYTDLLSSADLSTASQEEVIAAYQVLEQTIDGASHSVLDFFEGGREGCDNFLETLSELNEGWASKDENDNWSLGINADNMDEIADTLGIDVEALQSILKKVSDYDYGFEFDFEEPAENLENLKEVALSAQEALSDSGDNLNLNLDDDSLSGIEGQIETVEDYIEQVKDSDLSPELQTEKIEQANDLLEYLITKKQEIGESVQVDLDINQDELQGGYDTLNKLKSNLTCIEGSVGLDRQGFQAGIVACMADINSMSPELKVALGIQNLSPEEIKQGLINGTIEVPVNADTSGAANDLSAVQDKNINVYK